MHCIANRWLSQGTILVSSVSTIAILMRNTLVKKNKNVLQCGCGLFFLGVMVTDALNFDFFEKVLLVL